MTTLTPFEHGVLFLLLVIALVGLLTLAGLAVGTGFRAIWRLDKRP